MIPGVSKDQEALLIALKRPIIFILPAAFDKGMKFELVLYLSSLYSNRIKAAVFQRSESLYTVSQKRRQL